MHLDDSVLQSKTATTLINVLKDARTITRSNSNACKAINKRIEECVKAHSRAAKMVRVGKKQQHVNGKSTFLGAYKVHI
tara:strand:- start:360 stop:596 length:237 start_codon:yes stop_codon:yes gene_type:complete